MKLIVILICIALERYAGVNIANHLPGWFEKYNTMFQGYLPEKLKQRAWLNFTILLLPLLLAMLFLQCVLGGLFAGVFGFVVSLGVLMLCMQSEHYQLRWKHYFAGVKVTDNTLVLTHDNPGMTAQDNPTASSAQENAPEANMEIVNDVIVNTNYHLFSVMFWFLVLGPFGAVLYRYCRWLSESADQAESIASVAARWEQALAWLPTQLLVFTYAFVGHFMRTFGIWRQYIMSSASGWSWNPAKLIATVSANEDLLRGTALAAMGFDENKDVIEDETVINAVGLVNRALVVWLCIIAVLTLTAIIS